PPPARSVRQRAACRRETPAPQPGAGSSHERYRRDPSEKGLYPGLGATENERVHVVRALIGIDRFQIGCVTHDVVADLDAVAAMHVPRHARDIEGLAAIVALD